MCCCFSRLVRKFYGCEDQRKNWIDVAFYIRLTTHCLDDGQVIFTKEVSVDDVVANAAQVRSILLSFLRCCADIGEWGQPDITKTNYYAVSQDSKKIMVRFEFKNSAGEIVSISDALEKQFHFMIHFNNHVGFGLRRLFALQTTGQPSNLLSLSFNIN